MLCVVISVGRWPLDWLLTTAVCISRCSLIGGSGWLVRERPDRIRETVTEVVEATGVLAGKRRSALDSTLLDDSVATQDTVTQLVAQIRRVRRMIPEARVVAVSAHDYDRAGKPVCAWDDPEAKTALVTALVNDALAIVSALHGIDLDDGQADAVGLLALVAGPGCRTRRHRRHLADRTGHRGGPGHLNGGPRRPAMTPEELDAVAEGMAAAFLPLINAWRERNGLPPLPHDAAPPR